MKETINCRSHLLLVLRLPEPTLIAITQLQLLAHLYKRQTDLGFIDSSWILEFPLHLLGGVVSFVTAPCSFPLEVSLELVWLVRTAASPGEGTRWLQEVRG